MVSRVHHIYIGRRRRKLRGDTTHFSILSPPSWPMKSLFRSRFLTFWFPTPSSLSLLPWGHYHHYPPKKRISEEVFSIFRLSVSTASKGRRSKRAAEPHRLLSPTRQSPLSYLRHRLLWDALGVYLFIKCHSSGLGKKTKQVCKPNFLDNYCRWCTGHRQGNFFLKNFFGIP